MEFPLQLSFKLLALSPQIAVTEASGALRFYVKQKLFKLKEAVTVFADEAQTRPVYRIAADRVLDISATYHVTDEATGAELGSLQRKGMRSIWRAHYEIHRGGGPILNVREENPWVKVIDSVVGEIPVVGMLTGYVFNPAYRVTRASDGSPVMRIVKRPALFEGRYTIERLGELSENDETLTVLSALMMLLLERRRG